jgi:POT family proton-dependent oligopeptide transporter
MAYWLGLAFALIAATGLITRGSGSSAVGNGEDSESLAAAKRSVPFTSEDWQRIAVILIVAIFSIVFWMGFEQAGGTFTLFADAETDRSVPSFVQRMTGEPTFPASLYQTINPLLIVLLAPLPLVLWNALERAGIRVNSAAKMGLGLLLLGVGFIVMDYADKRYSVENKAGAQWLAIVYFFNSIGELCLSPIGLSLVNKLSPLRIASLMMAIWFLCTAIANYLAGKMEQWLLTYAPDLPLFTFLIWTSLVSGVLLLALNPVLRKMGHGRI